MLDARLTRSRRKRPIATLPPRLSAWPRALAQALAVAATVGVAPAARGADHELSRVTATALSLEFGGALLLAGMTLLPPIPQHCRWCEPPGFDESLAIPAAPEARGVAGTMSHVFSFAVIPTVMVSALLVPPLTSAESDGHAYQNLLIMTEVVVVDLALTLAVKKWIARRRPAFHYGRTAYTEYALGSREANISFFSGDTSAAFAAASSAATLSFLRGYRSAPYLTAAGATFATVTGLLRSAADVHWPSDILTGALIGVGLGVAMPLLLHPRLGTSSEASANTGAPLAPAGTGELAIVQFSGAF